MFERRDLIDAIKVKEVRTGSDIDEKAGAEVHRRLVAPSLYARGLHLRVNSGTPSRICNWRKQIPCDIQRNNDISFVRQSPASAPTPSLSPLEVVVVKYIVVLAERKLLFSIANGIFE